jgi:hypothetical protein
LHTPYSNVSAPPHRTGPSFSLVDGMQKAAENILAKAVPIFLASLFSS